MKRIFNRPCLFRPYEKGYLQCCSLRGLLCRACCRSILLSRWTKVTKTHLPPISFLNPAFAVNPSQFIFWKLLFFQTQISYIYSPTYSLGIWSMIVAHLLQSVIISSLGILLARENKRRDRLQSSQAGGLEGRDLSSTAFSDMTDKENLKYVLLKSIFKRFSFLSTCSFFHFSDILALSV